MFHLWFWRIMYPMLWRSHMQFLRYSVFYVSNHFSNLESSDVMIIISLWGRVHLWIYLLNDKTFFSLETWPTNRFCLGQFFLKIFYMIWRIGSLIRFLNLPKLVKNHLWWIFVFSLFWRRRLRQAKMVNIIH